MKPGKALLKKVSPRVTQGLLKKLEIAMKIGDYEGVDDLLSKNPCLIYNLTAKCEVPLVMAIRCFDPHLVSICVEHGANPNEEHSCSKDDGKPKRPMLIAAEELIKRTKKVNSKSWQSIYEIYSHILSEMGSVAPLKSSGR